MLVHIHLVVLNCILNINCIPYSVILIPWTNILYGNWDLHVIIWNVSIMVVIKIFCGSFSKGYFVTFSFLSLSRSWGTLPEKGVDHYWHLHCSPCSWHHVCCGLLQNQVNFPLLLQLWLSLRVQDPFKTKGSGLNSNQIFQHWHSCDSGACTAFCSSVAVTGASSRANPLSAAKQSTPHQDVKRGFVFTAILLLFIPPASLLSSKLPVLGSEQTFLMAHLQHPGTWIVPKVHQDCTLKCLHLQVLNHVPKCAVQYIPISQKNSEENEKPGKILSGLVK